MSDVSRALFLLVNASRVDPVLRQAVATVEAEVERLTRERDDEVERHAAFSRAVGDAVAPLGNRYLDPPDGGSVDLPEFIARAVADLLRVERERDEARAALSEVAPAIHATHDLILREYAEPDPTTGEVIASEARSVWYQVCDALAALAALPTPEEADRAE